MATKRRAKGLGTLYQTVKGIWVGQISLPNGKKITKSSKTQKVVKDWLVGQQNAVKQGVWVEDASITLSDFLDHFLNDTLKNRVKPKTLDSYTYLIRKHIEPTLGYIKLSELRPHQLQALYAQKVESGLSPRTVQYIHAVIHRVLEQAVKWNLVVRNVAGLVDSPKPVKKTPQTLSVDQAKRLLEYLKDDRLHPLYALAIGCGLRLGELLALEWEVIDLKTGSLSVLHTLQYLPGRGLVIGEPKTEKSRRSIIMPGFVVESLKVHQSKTGSKSGLVFTTSNGTPFALRNIERHFHATLDKLDIPQIRFHDLRHTAATFLLLEGVHPKLVQEMLGHSSITLTLDCYSHVIPTMQKDAADKMQNLFKN